jgi:hypothetical protein
MPAHSSHLLQPLDVGCFSVLKRAYGLQVSDFMRLGINHIDKHEFLYALNIARIEAFTEANIKSSFAATGLVPYNPDQVLSTIQIRPRTPPQTTIANPEQWQPQTPRNLAELECQVGAIKDYLKRRSNSPPTPTHQALNQLVKGCQIAMQGAVLLATENERLRAANERQTQKRQIKRQYISKTTALTVAEASKLLDPSQVPQIVQDNEVDQESDIQENGLQEEILPEITCYICRRSDHFASDCTKYR